VRLSLRAPGAVRPRVDPRELDVGIVHLGLGNFHRAHQAVYTEDAPEPWGICGVTMRRRDTVDLLAPQDGLYSLLTRGPSEDSVRVVGVLREVFSAAEHPARLRDRLAAPSTHVVTITVTELGYDLAAAHLVGGFAARRDAGVEVPLAVVSCDNLPRNGRLVRERVLAACRDDDLAAWVDDHVTFPSSMVDRMVPTPTAADRSDASRLIGADDLAAVVAEPFSQWVLEDRFGGPRPAWEQAGVLLVPDAGPYETMKLRVLNGSHSALAYLGLAAGFETVAEAVSDPGLEEFVRALVAEELRPTLAPVPGIDLDAYVDDVFARFANPRIAYRLEQIAGGGEAKVQQRLLPPARELLAAGREPVRIWRVLAAWLRWEGRPLDDPLVDDDLRPLIAAHAGSPPPARAPRRSAGT
jgi:fructuronate reductase